MAVAVVQGDKFLDLVQQSGLVDGTALASYREQTAERDSTDLAAALIRAGLLTNFQAKHLLSGRYRGLILGHYKLLDQIGKGGMGTVYLAEHKTLKRKAAVKVLAVDQTKTVLATERFYREARAAATLDHPNVVKVYDVGQYGNVHYIAMEYIEGQTLGQMIERNGPLHFATACDYVAQASAGLQAAHEKGLVHRDIKPDNLIVDKSGTVKILDMGLARSSEDPEDRLTAHMEPEVIVGTADYIAPEQALNEPVDVRADIYSLGVTFFVLLTGRPPFTGTTAQKLAQHQLRAAPSLVDLRAKAPAELGEVIARMLQKKPGDRFQTPAEVIEALAPWLSPEAMANAQPSTVTATLTRASGRSSTTRRVVKPGRPKWFWPVLGGGLAALLLVAGLLVAKPWESDAPKPGGPTAAVPPPNAGPPTPNWAELPPPPPGSLVVASDGPEPRYPTVAAALAAAKPGPRTVILIRNPVHSEQLVLTAAKGGNVSIESGLPNTPIQWVAPPGAPDKPLLDISGAEGVRVSGVRFDGQGRTADLIRAAGKCPDLTLEDVAALGYARSAISLQGVSGAEGKPVTVRRFRATGAGDGASGVLLEGGPAHNHLRVIDSRFEGPLAAGVTVSGPVQNLEVRRNRFHRLRHGVYYRPTGPATAFSAQVRGNTFVELTSGVEFAVSPPGTDTLVAVVDNLFVQCGHLAQLTNTPLMPEGPGPAWVWYPEFEKNTNIPPQTRYFRREFKLAAKPTGPVTLNIGVDESFAVWVNGREVGKSAHAYFSQRVYALDVTNDLVAGANVIAVQAVNELDPFSKAFGTAAGVMAQLVEAAPEGPKVLLTTDEQWKASKTKGDGWDRAGFDEIGWEAVKGWNIAGINFPWRETVWDSVVAQHLRGPNRPVRLTVAGNVRDYFSMEGYPVLESKRALMTVRNESLLGLDPADDERFLRYPMTSLLVTGGSNQGPVGVPPPGL